MFSAFPAPFLGFEPPLLTQTSGLWEAAVGRPGGAASAPRLPGPSRLRGAGVGPLPAAIFSLASLRLIHFLK